MRGFFAKLYSLPLKNKQKKELIYRILHNKDGKKVYPVLLDALNTIHKNINTHPQLYYKVSGSDNKIILIENNAERELAPNETIPGLSIMINGNNNTIRLELPIKAANSKIEIKNDNAKVEIGTTNCFQGVFISCRRGQGQKVKIGRGTTIFGANIILEEQSSISIGEDCMFSNSIRIWTSDAYAILDADTGKVLNVSNNSVEIGNHCWLAEAVRITKNARIGNNCVIGGGAVACKDYGEDNVIIAGNPGKIIKRGVTWSRLNAYQLEYSPK